MYTKTYAMKTSRNLLINFLRLFHLFFALVIKNSMSELDRSENPLS